MRVIEHGDGTWSCRQGRLERSRHDTEQGARDDALAIADACRPASVLLHRLDGSVMAVASLD